MLQLCHPYWPALGPALSCKCSLHKANIIGCFHSRKITPHILLPLLSQHSWYALYSPNALTGSQAIWNQLKNLRSLQGDLDQAQQQEHCKLGMMWKSGCHGRNMCVGACVKPVHNMLVLCFSNYYFFLAAYFKRMWLEPLIWIWFLFS